MTININIIQNFYNRLNSIGAQGRIVHAKHIPDLRADIRKYYEQNLIYPQLYEDYKAYFEFEPKVDFAKIDSLFIVSIPVPQFEAKFHYKGKELILLIPPTYLYSTDIINQMKNMLAEILKPKGFNYAYAQLPQKTLAVRSGLAKYGRNNISYVPGMGSFYRLVTFYTDVAIEQDNWYDLSMMELCKECSACVRNCPTGAIPTDRFLLRAGKCLTFHNEQPGDVSFPNWINPFWHNCLVGCLRCQKICPANKKVKEWTEPGPNFSEKETEWLLNTYKLEDLPERLKEKLVKYDLGSYSEVFPRNLNVFLKNF
ncbi:MAG: 4Fe-4S double cluster binding domain-containing protein [Promethearchaeota archaeon]